MKKIFLATLLSAALLLSGCKQETGDKITFATSADYPPFEFHKNNKITGFDIELATLVAKEMHKEAKFEDMQFSSILAALQNGLVDAAISTITITAERKKNFDFSNSYYEESMSMLYPEASPLKEKADLTHKKIACQLGTTMEIWLKKNMPDTEMVIMNDNNQAVEALKAGHVDGVLVDSVQAVAFASKNPGLAYNFIAKSDNGYAIAVKQGSKLTEEINTALNSLQKKGELDRLKKKWLENAEWNS